jgi:hypothetical protein
MFQFNKNLVVLGLSIVTLFSGNILTTTTASAQYKLAGAVKDVTLWSKKNRQGSSFESDKGVPDLSQVGFDDKASSIAVNNGQKWRFYKDKNFQGEFIEIGPNDFSGHLGHLNNQVSSFKSVP